MERTPRSPPARAAFAGATIPILILILLVAGFTALGTWQVQRRAWKLDLIAKVDQRIHAPVADAPGPAQWPAITAENDEYRRVRVSGNFLFGRETLVAASTELGSGFWVMTPLRMADGSTILINRGFVLSERDYRAAHTSAASAPSATPDNAVTVTGLLRTTQPNGGFLRHNDPAANRWFSRDVQAIAAARGLHHVAPYFVDADATADALPVGGLTVVTFPNSHLAYAITWYVLALMTAAAAWRMGREPNILRAKRDREDDTSH
ncbi:MAG TPA: SURF1 family protein [Herbaspirillum sp.]|nr:SURF1 family protein [Herbaspirillum sp.]